MGDDSRSTSPYPSEPAGGWRSGVPTTQATFTTRPSDGILPAAPRLPPAPLAPIRAMAHVSLGIGALYTALAVGGAVVSWVRPAQAHEMQGYLLNIPLGGWWAGAGFVACLALWVVTCTWLFRARQNAERISPMAHKRSETWVWLGWIVPIVSFWFPFQVVRDILKASHAGVVPGRLWLGLWWACWIIPMLLQPASRVTSQEDGMVTSAMTVNPGTATVNALLGVIAFVLWVRIVRAIVDAQDPQR